MRWLIALVLLAATASAEEPRKEKRTVVRFDGDAIDGDVVRPEGDLVAARPQVSLPTLVAPPASFDREAARDLQRAAQAAGALVRQGGGDGD